MKTLRWYEALGEAQSRKIPSLYHLACVAYHAKEAPTDLNLARDEKEKARMFWYRHTIEHWLRITKVTSDTSGPCTSPPDLILEIRPPRDERSGEQYRVVCAPAVFRRYSGMLALIANPSEGGSFCLLGDAGGR